jgi:late competence protein required for DNA uptake (superfamily II DNA/RNA helicase)
MQENYFLIFFKNIKGLQKLKLSIIFTQTPTKALFKPIWSQSRETNRLPSSYPTHPLQHHKNLPFIYHNSESLKYQKSNKENETIKQFQKKKKNNFLFPRLITTMITSQYL